VMTGVAVGYSAKMYILMLGYGYKQGQDTYT
jgi:hypothetical protein